MEELEYITYKAMIECDQGSAPGLFKPAYNQTVKINDCKVSTTMDKVPLTHIPDFVVCKKTQKPCVPVPAVWKDTYPVKVKGQQTLIGKSCIDCGVGGKIGFMTSGQVPLSPEEEDQLNGMRDDVKKAYDAEQAEKNKPWWKKVGEFVVDCVPVVGPIVSMAKNISEGNWGMAALDAGFLALDVVGLVAAPFTGGASVAGTTALKIGARQAIKAGVKQVAKKASKEAIEAGVKQTAEMLSKLSVKSLTRGKLCVFACFPAGTLVAVKDGHKPIEDITEGDEVWAYHEGTGVTSLQKVTNAFAREAHTLVTIITAQESIRATPEHPFYADGAWKEAGLLEAGNTLQLKNGKQAVVQQVIYHYNAAEVAQKQPVAAFESSEINERSADENSVKVYNFTVAEAHNYFVGEQEILVHNTSKAICVKGAIKKVSDRLKKVGRTPGKNSATGKKVWDRQVKEGTAIEFPDGTKMFQDPTDKQWYDLSKADMGHYKEAAVDYWNREGYKHGPKSKKVREWMRDPDNYQFEHFSNNRSAGATAGKTTRYR